MDSQILDVLALIAGALLSVIVEIPAIKKYYDRFTDGQKRLAMGGLLILAAGLVYGLACAYLLDDIFPGLAIQCTQAGLALLIRAVFLALVSNQGTFGLAFRGKPKPQPAREEDYYPTR